MVENHGLMSLLFCHILVPTYFHDTLLCLLLYFYISWQLVAILLRFCLVPICATVFPIYITVSRLASFLLVVWNYHLWSSFPFKIYIVLLLCCYCNICPICFQVYLHRPTVWLLTLPQKFFPSVYTQFFGLSHVYSLLIQLSNPLKHFGFPKYG